MQNPRFFSSISCLRPRSAGDAPRILAPRSPLEPIMKSRTLISTLIARLPWSCHAVLSARSISALGIGVLLASAHSTPASADLSVSSSKAALRTSFASLPLAFEAGVDSAGTSSNFFARGRNYEFRIRPAGAELIFYRTPSSGPAAPLDRAHVSALNSGAARTVRINFVRANPSPAVQGLALLPGKINYLVGNDPALWRTQIGAYAQSRFRRSIRA